MEAAERLRGKPGRERQLADLLARAARGLAARGDTAGALARLDEAAALFAGGVGADDREALESAAEVEALAGRLQVVLGSTAEAWRRFRQALSMREGLVGRYPDHFDLWWALAASYTDMGDLMKALGEGEPARQYFEQALQISQKLVSQEPGRADYLRDLSVSYERMAGIAREGGQHDDAAQYLAQAVSLRTRLVDQEPARADLRLELARTLMQTLFPANLAKAEEILVGLPQAPEVTRALGVVKAMRAAMAAGGAV